MAKYTMVKVKKAGGGHRMQRAMVLASGKYRFVSNKGGHSRRKTRKSPVAKHRRRRRTHSRALVRRSSYHPRRRRRRHHGGGGGGIKPLPFAIAAGGIAWLTSKSGPSAVKNLTDKIPGNKTFGAPAVLGISCLLADKFLKRNKWLRLAGYAGIAAAAMKVGEQGSSFKWVGDSDDMGDIDLAGDYDMGDVEDVGDDEMGDEDMGDED